jgi:hypothetical protein
MRFFIFIVLATIMSIQLNAQIKVDYNLIDSRSNVNSSNSEVVVTNNVNIVNKGYISKELVGSYYRLNLTAQDSLYKGHNYDYYHKLYKNSTTVKNIGTVLTFFGFGASVFGALMLSTNSDNPQGIVTGLYIGGAIVSNVGIVMWISNGVKAANNREAMKMTKSSANLSFGSTNNGVGLALRF